MVNPRSCLVTFFVLLLLASLASIFIEYGHDSELGLKPTRERGWNAGEVLKDFSENEGENVVYENEIDNKIDSVKDTVPGNTVDSDGENNEKKVKENGSVIDNENKKSVVHNDIENSKKSVISNTTEDDLETVKRKARLRARNRSESLKEYVQNACDTLDLSLNMNSEMLKHMLVDDARQVMYCFVPKVACTSWKRIWMRMVGLVSPDVDIDNINRNIVHKAKIPSLQGEDSKYIIKVLKSYKKYMFVRHPFDRALSAYKDKFENKEAAADYSFHKDIGVKIKAKYNPGYRGNGDGVKFSEFIDYISDDEDDVSLTLGQKNEHWLSVHELCNPCYVQYDFIGKYERLKEDADYVLDWIGVSDLPHGFPASDRPFHAKRYDPKYFGQLNHDLRTAFFKKYLEDFVVLNYTFV
ncbi:Carbohydrate sulfotransferase 14 [Halocaridina rubra]|uniref:Carbohydrate sulfotransferase n=1 Tax=Halocaridina rubra TaxID=373956 RepID=A0AAN8WIF3_HALRR